MQAVLYTWRFCPFCIYAKQLLEQLSIPFEEIEMDGRNSELAALKAKYGHPTVPIILLDGEFIGGYDELSARARAGELPVDPA